mmetsp:Transcript_17393/g.37566  ORF Transcript_17393/g.37566 Transcript_17393/m.37566 type:complete len:711 (+) Transcript_17393:43-2175(+)
MNNNDILDSVGGSLLNDLLSDLNAAVAASHTQSNCHDRSDDLFALLEQELTSTYANSPRPPPPFVPPSMQQRSPAAFVVNQQANYLSSGTSDDAWSTALSQFGSMSLAADFLAADTAKKLKQEELRNSTPPAMLGDTTLNPFDKLFEDDEDYVLEEEVVFDRQRERTADELNESGSLTLSGALRAKNSHSFESKLPEVALAHQSTEAKKVIRTEMNTVPDGTPPSPPFPRPITTQYRMPVPPPTATGTMRPHPMIFNSTYMPPPQLSVGFPSPHGMVQEHEVAKQLFDTEEFPALGVRTELQEGEKNQEWKECVTAKEESIFSCTTITSDTGPIFNNANPGTAPVDAHHLSAKLMPSKDVCFIVNLMLRPLQSLDIYNDDYYHWSVVNRESPILSRVKGTGPVNNTFVAQPTPVRKGVKVTAKEQEDKFHAAVKARAKNFAQEKKSLGQLVKTNVKRPKALLNTPVLKRATAEENLPDLSQTDTKYESEQQTSRINLWKARVSIDRGYAAFLSLVELRRLIQAHVGAPQLIDELMVDVKTNVDLLHSSLGVTIQLDPKGSKKIEIERWTLASTLSLPKGRVLCARVIEEGILPHLSACNILPAALSCIFSWSYPATEGEDRLLHALTGLILTPQPSIDPLILYRCLDMSILVADNKEDLSSITCSHMRTKLLHAILSTGKDVCASSLMGEAWSQKEKLFLDTLLPLKFNF